MAFRDQDFYSDPNALAPHYTHFRVGERLLLTGHSHQAWPDRARDAQIEAFDDAAEWVDKKWDRAFQKASRVQQGIADRMGDSALDSERATGTYTLASNTHDLLIRFLSALDLKARPRLVTTDGEFHTIRRQLARLEECGIEVVRESAKNPETLTDRLAAAVDDRTAAVLVSTVLYGTGRIVPGLDLLSKSVLTHGAELLIDTYHSLNAVPFDIRAAGLDHAFAVGGGYKYLQLGEGNCFLRVPPNRDLRPVVTGWFAEFDALSAAPGKTVAYGPGASAFGGATYDPTSHYRGAAVLDFFDDLQLTPELLRRVSQHQIARLSAAFDALDADPERINRPEAPFRDLGAFLTLQTPEAEALHDGLRQRGVATDFRGRYLRFGPAPYLCDRQLDDAMGLLGELLGETSRS